MVTKEGEGVKEAGAGRTRPLPPAPPSVALAPVPPCRHLCPLSPSRALRQRHQGGAEAAVVAAVTGRR
ncbi:hypothetical protein E2C01_073228 [Portunus trituberculatus]|uniref:Uncharacterized protein n=1 Tax=Portunus trituberculatus TaxID=210409 RepID=A0A5B7I077_PORTR|nr:hypothetical protein [Portunus trituberculatus]